jgi:hypothetical protein
MSVNLRIGAAESYSPAERDTVNSPVRGQSEGLRQNPF